MLKTYKINIGQKSIEIEIGKFRQIYNSENSLTDNFDVDGVSNLTFNALCISSLVRSPVDYFLYNTVNADSSQAAV